MFDLQVPEVITWRCTQHAVPSRDELETMILHHIGETPAGTQVPADHPDSWLRLLGIL